MAIPRTEQGNSDGRLERLVIRVTEVSNGNWMIGNGDVGKGWLHRHFN